MKNVLQEFYPLVIGNLFVDTPHENKTGVKTIDGGELYQAVRDGNISADKSNTDHYMQPHSKIQQQCIEPNDIDVLSLRQHNKNVEHSLSFSGD